MPTRKPCAYPLPRADTLHESCLLAASQLRSDVIYFHARALKETGGEPGVLSEANLESAVHRPFAMYGGTSAYNTPLEQAAALFESLNCNHAFLDANKRTGTATCLYFLTRSNYWLGLALLTDKERVQLLELSIAIAQGGWDHADIVRALGRILEPTRNRRPRPSRILAGLFGPIGQYLNPPREG